VGIDHIEQVVGFFLGDADLGRVAGVLAVGRADDGELIHIRNGEHNPLVFVLQDKGIGCVIQFGHDQVAALDQANTVRRIQLQVVLDELGDPRAGSIDQGFAANRKQAAISALQIQFPQPFVTTRTDAARLGVNMGAFFSRSHCVEYYQACVIYPAIGVFKAFGDFCFQRAVGAELEAGGTCEFFALAQVVIKEQPGTDHPRRAQVRAVRQDKTHRLDDMRGLGQQHFAFGQGFAHQAKFVMLKVTQATVDQLAAGRGRVAGQVVLFAKEHRQAATGCVCRNPDAIDSAANNGNVVDLSEGSGRQGGQGHGVASRSLRIFECEH